MSLRNLLAEKKLVSCRKNDSIKTVASLMDKEDVGAVLILEDGKPEGIVTDRDIVVRCVVEGKNCADTTVDDIMTEGVETVNVDDGIYNVIQVMKENEVRRVPVVDKDGKAIGLLSLGDIMQLLGEEIHDLLGPTAPEKPKIQDLAA